MYTESVYKKRKRVNWRQGREEKHCDICVSMFSYDYPAGFGTRIQKTCKALDMNTTGINVCDLFKNKS